MDPHWWWLAGAALLAILEIAVPGTFLFVWLAAAALITGLLVLILDIALPFQLAAFALLALASVYVGRRWYDRNPVESSDPMLNDRTRRLIGETVVVVSAIEGGSGRVRVGDSVWPARGPDAAVGTRMRVTSADGTCLHVQALMLPQDKDRD